MSKDAEIAKEMIKKGKAMIAKAENKLAELEVTYSTGDRFKDKDGKKHLLVYVGGLALVDLKRGLWIKHPVQIEGSLRCITQDEFDQTYETGSFTRYWNDKDKIYTGDKKKGEKS